MTSVPPRVLAYDEARAIVLAAARPLGTERVPLGAALGRAIAREARAAHPLPPFDNSSMDGWAVRAADLAGASADHPLELPVVAVIAAGRVAERPLAAGEAMRIMTGAALPAGADAVVPFEDGARVGGGHDERACFTQPVAAGASIRRAGADLAAGDVALAAGRTLSAHDLAVLAALGIAEVEVGERPRVAVVSTGDELLDVHEALRPGAIRDSNVPMLAALITEAGGVVTTTERVADDPAAVATRLEAAFASADVVLTIGGVSAGDFDPVKLALDGLSGAELWRVAMKPGRPQAFGSHDHRLFFGLPGNPASVACVFEALVRPVLRRLGGHAAIDRPRLAVRAAQTIESRAGRTDFVRVTLAWKDGAWWAAEAGEQISGHVLPQARAHALLVVPEAVASLAAGDAAEALLLRWPDAGR